MLIPDADPRPFVRTVVNCLVEGRAGDAMLILDSAVRSGCNPRVVNIELVGAVAELFQQAEFGSVACR